MIDSNHPQLSIQKQCKLVSISRPAFYYQPMGETPLNIELMKPGSAIRGDAKVRLAPDGPLSAPAGPYGGPQAGSAAHGQDGPRGDLPGAAYDDPASGAPDL